MESKRTVLILLAAALSLFAVLTALVVAGSALVDAMNRAAYAPLAALISPAPTAAAVWLGRLGGGPAYAVAILALLAIPRTRAGIGMPLAAAQIVSAILGPLVLKNIFAIERPDWNPLIYAGGFGYPSGHSMNAAVFFGMCAVLLARRFPNRRFKACGAAIASGAAFLVGASRVYLGVHTAADVAGGYLMGAAVICAALLFEGRMKGSAPGAPSHADVAYARELQADGDLFGLYKALGWNGLLKLSESQLAAAMERSFFAVYAYCGSRLVGTGRVVSDGAISAYICGVGVLPDFRRRGIGAAIIQKLAGHCRENGLRAQLVCDEGLAAYYEKMGFEKFAVGMKKTG